MLRTWKFFTRCSTVRTGASAAPSVAVDASTPRSSAEVPVAHELLAEVARRELIVLPDEPSAGTWASQISAEYAQRGWNAQPDGGASMSAASRGSAAAAAVRERRHRGNRPTRVRMPRVLEDVVDVADFRGAARVHHLHPVGDTGDDAEVVGDEHDRGLRQLLHLLDAPRGSAPGSSRRALWSARRR